MVNQGIMGGKRGFCFPNLNKEKGQDLHTSRRCLILHKPVGTTGANLLSSVCMSFSP